MLTVLAVVINVTLILAKKCVTKFFTITGKWDVKIGRGILFAIMSISESKRKAKRILIADERTPFTTFLVSIMSVLKYAEICS